MTEQIERVEATERAETATQERSGYDARAAQQRWQAFWAADQTFVPADDGSSERRYVLDMFPYPSGDLHMGHAEAFVMGDVVASTTSGSGPPRLPVSSASMAATVH